MQDNASEVSITVNNKEYVFSYCEIPFSALMPDSANPRFQAAIALKGGQPLTDNEIIDNFSGDEPNDRLWLSIKKNGGAINPLIVQRKGGKYLIREGNRRWFAYHRLQDDPEVADGRFGKVPCYIVPDDMAETAIEYYLQSIHGVGTVDWPPEAKIAYAAGYQERYGVTDKEAAAIGGYEEKSFSLLKKVYGVYQEYRKATKDTRSHWSQWCEAIRSSPTKVLSALEVEDDKRKIFSLFHTGKMLNPYTARKLAVLLDNRRFFNRVVEATNPAEIKTIIDLLPSNRSSTDVAMTSINKTTGYLRDRKEAIVSRLLRKDRDDVRSIEGLLKSLLDILYESDNRAMLTKFTKRWN